jgi:outer membrane protein TolC
MKEESRQIQAMSKQPVRDKRDERIEAFQGALKARKTELEARWKEYLAGRGTLDFLLQASSGLLECELKLADEGLMDKLTAFNDQRVRMFELYLLQQKRFAAGKIATQDLAQTTGAYELARAQFVQAASAKHHNASRFLAAGAKQPKAPQSSVEPTKEQILTLQSALLDAAKLEWESRRLEFEAGRGTFDFLIASSRRLREAQLKIARSSDERLEAYRAHAERLKHIEATIEQRFEAGKVATQELQHARYHRIDAELEVAQFLQQLAY